MRDPSDPVEPIKDKESARPVATAWRPVLREIVKAFAEGDYSLSRGIDSVEPVSAADAERIRRYVADYGETLAEVPDQTWETSISQWTGAHWDVMVDLWTEQSGRSDMVLSARVYEEGAGFRFKIHMVYVP